jgi:hypothetical protein
MLSIVNAVRIAGPVPAVFDLVTSARFWPQWHPASQVVGGVTQRPYQLGDLIHERGEIAGIHFDVTWEVEEHKRPSHVVLRSQAPAAQIMYTFEERGDATEFRRELECDEKIFPALAADPVTLGRFVHAQSEEALRRLKELVEGILHEERTGFADHEGDGGDVQG